MLNVEVPVSYPLSTRSGSGPGCHKEMEGAFRRVNRHRRIIGRETKIRLSALLRVFVSESCIHELRIFTDFNRLRTSRTLGMPSPHHGVGVFDVETASDL